MSGDYGELADRMCDRLGEDLVHRAELDFETMSAGLKESPSYLGFLRDNLSYLERAYDALGNGIYKSVMSGKVALADYSDELVFAGDMGYCIDSLEAKAGEIMSELAAAFSNLSSV